jgi:HK97 family phage portal protein
MSGILSSLIERRFHVSQSPPGWVEKWARGDTTAGVGVDEESALTYIAVYTCIQILSETLASLPLITYKRLKGGGKERAQDFYLYPILHDMANPEMTAYKFRETLMGHAASWGNGYAQIISNQAGQVMELWPLRPDKMTVKRVNGQLQYIYRLTEPDGQGKLERTFPAYQIFHLPGLGFDGITGYSPIAMARQAIGLGLAAEEFGARFFGNDARPGIVLQHPGILSDKAYKNLKDSWEEEHQGVHKSHKPMILEEGTTFKEIGIPPEEAQFLATRKFQVQEIARLYRIPPHMLADLEKSSYASIEQQGLEFVTYTLLPWAVRWEQCIYKYLLTPEQRKSYFAEHLMDVLMRGDIKSRYDAYHIARLDGWMNVDEIREKENMNPLEDGQGQVYLVPLNMVAAGPVTPQAPQGRAILLASGAMRGLYLDTLGRILRREKNDLLSIAKKYTSPGDPKHFLDRVNEFYQDHVDFIVRQLTPVAESHAEALLPGEPRNRAFIRRYLKDYARRHIEISQKELKDLVLQVENGPIANICGDMEVKFEDWLAVRGIEIADQESLSFGNDLLKALEEGNYDRK